MAVKIDRISVKNLGPIKSFVAKFGLLNLIYSRNEKGKTFLTEFIIRSLFKNISRWSYLREGGRGKIIVSGLEDDAVEFSPSSQKKLENYWEGDEKELSPSMAKLLVVKGGEAGIENSEEGISKFLIKEVLSGMNILDRIDNDSNISKTVKSAEVRDNQISIPQRGEGKQYNDIKDELSSVEELFEEIESQYTQGILKTYKIGEKALREKLELLNRAKRHKAYLISEKIKKLEKELSNIPEDELSQLETNLSLYRSKKESYDKLEEKYKDALGKSKDFGWLESALSHYKDLTSKIIKRPGKFLSFIWGILLGTLSISAVAIVLILFNQEIFGIICFLIALVYALVLSLVYIRKIYDTLRQAGQSQELNRIKVEFKRRTGKELTDIALLESVLKKQGEHNSQSKIIKEQLDGMNEELQDLHFSINQKIISLTGKEIQEPNWDIIVRDLKQNHGSLRNKIDDEKEKLYKLGVPETDYLGEDEGIKYSQEEYERVQKELKDIQQKIESQENKLNNLKYKVYSKTKDDPSISWEELIENLRQKRWEVQKELREATAKIIAGIIVHKVITKLREEEDTKIQKGLQSHTVLRPLRDLTQRYNRLALDGDKLIVSDEYDNFDLKDLSTGAKEQVMLALRIGFSSKLLKKDALFLILDDAFQHSDWQKREILTNQLTDIAKKGWQIIYLTMDDHIKELFDKVGKEFKAGEYKSLKL